MEREIRAGMWVVYNKKCGIAFEWRENNEKQTLHREVHLVDDQGQTALVVPVESFAGLKQAHFEDIPSKRRPPKSTAQKLGYFTRGKK